MEILNSTGQLLYDKSRETELMDILGIESMDEVAIIPWRPPTTRPKEASYVFLKYYDIEFNTVSFDFFSYENGTYTYYYGTGGSFDLPHSQVLGWAYPINFAK